MPTLKELVQKPKKIMSGHRSCRGCGFPIIARHILRATDKPVVVVNATGCMEVTTTIYPQTAWQIPWMHNAFENAAATMSGIVAAYNFLKKSKKINKEIKFVVFGGDGGTYDIGLQALSGAWERGDNFLYVCYDNQAYMNTGIQRSSATPVGAITSTTPLGEIHKGKEGDRKDIVKIACAHNLPYVAQATIYNWLDLYNKAKKAIETNGPTFLNVLSPCVLGWKYDSALTVELSRLAVETCYWPLYEIEKGVYKINYIPRNKLPVTEFIKHQARFKHLLKEENKEILNHLQRYVDQSWENLLKTNQAI